MVVASANAEKHLRGINIVAEIEVVDLINISSVHIGLEKGVKDALRS